ncbi:MAG: hypothetical protein NTZ78_06370 [Candidatus Aureabacteria bacterium]|nr:hypothetical protein [Candidatus Auribacterota bacterium]
MREGMLEKSEKERERLRVVNLVKGLRIILKKAAELITGSYQQCRIYKPPNHVKDVEYRLIGIFSFLHCMDKDLLQKRSGVISAGEKAHSARPPSDDQRLTVVRPP